jgi:hypothetical protein
LQPLQKVFDAYLLQIGAFGRFLSALTYKLQLLPSLLQRRPAASTQPMNLWLRFRFTKRA